MASARHEPIHPGEILKAEFLEPHELSQARLARETGMPADRVARLVKGTRAFTADTALRLSRYFGTTPVFWLNLQARYDLDIVRDEKGRQIDKDVTPLDAA